MRRRDEQKRRTITTTAARLFATQPFHKVRLDAVASAARVGKGTLYVYFRSKEDLYYSIIYEGFAGLVDRLVQQAKLDEQNHLPAMRRLETIVSGLVDFAIQHPQLFELMRTVGAPPQDGPWADQRRALSQTIERAIRQGVRSRELRDADPQLTAQFIPGFVRSAMLYGPKRLTRQRLTRQIMHLLRHGLSSRSAR